MMSVRYILILTVVACFATMAVASDSSATPLRAHRTAGLATTMAAHDNPGSLPRQVPAWLTLQSGTLVRVDSAPWFDSDEPEAALTASARSLRQDFSADGTRPDDVVYEPVGARARVLRVEAGGIALLRGTDRRWTAYAPIARLVPDVPRGTTLVVAGGFGGFADFYPSLTTPEATAARLPTGTRVVTLRMGVAPADPGTSNRVRIEVAVVARRNRSGWLEAFYTGLPDAAAPGKASNAEQACSCRILSFAVPRSDGIR